MPGARPPAGSRPRTSTVSRDEARRRRAETTELQPVEDAAARFLEVRPRSVAEVRRRLTQAGYPAPLVEEAIRRFGLAGYLDDAAFARAWVESRDRSRPRGEAALRRELRLKGIAPETIAAVLAERAAGDDLRRGGDSIRGPGETRPGVAGAHPGTLVTGPATSCGGVSTTPDEAAAGRLLAARTAALLRDRDPLHRKRRAYAMLARRGFDPAVCSAAVAAWLATVAPETDPSSPDEDDDPPV